jgi:hypothetical protein
MSFAFKIVAGPSDFGVMECYSSATTLNISIYRKKGAQRKPQKIMSIAISGAVF